jgi:hypothetical protein
VRAIAYVNVNFPILERNIERQHSSDRSTRKGHTGSAHQRRLYGLLIFYDSFMAEQFACAIAGLSQQRSLKFSA